MHTGKPEVPGDIFVDALRRVTETGLFGHAIPVQRSDLGLARGAGKAC